MGNIAFSIQYDPLLVESVPLIVKLRPWSMEIWLSKHLQQLQMEILLTNPIGVLGVEPELIYELYKQEIEVDNSTWETLPIVLYKCVVSISKYGTWLQV